MIASLMLALTAAGTAGAPAAEPGPDPLAGAYRWQDGGYVDVLVWNELGPGSLVAFDDEGWIRLLRPAGERTYTAGPAIAVSEPVAARVRFEPATAGVAAQSLVWQREGQEPRAARRVEDHRAEEVAFSNGETRLAGTLLLPPGRGPHPALVLLHGSGAQDRNGTLPFARFLVRHGVALLTTDKRGVGESGGDWREASFEVLAEDALAAVGFLRGRAEVDPRRIGLFGVSQGGWIGPLAASRSADVALVVSISGPGVTPAEQTLDLIGGEMRAEGFEEREIDEALALTRLAFQYGRTGKGWETYAAALAASAERSWLPYLSLPAEPEGEGWRQQRLFYHYDPAPALAALRCPVLAVFGGKDVGVPAAKNAERWRQALARGGHARHELVTLPAANHLMFEAVTGSLFTELPTLDRFVPGYRETLLAWLREAFRLGTP